MENPKQVLGIIMQDAGQNASNLTRNAGLRFACCTALLFSKFVREERRTAPRCQGWRRWRRWRNVADEAERNSLTASDIHRDTRTWTNSMKANRRGSHSRWQGAS
ncbi:hypothetical protein CLAIMM_12543 [Cladophialophora immunda]|nr:hypothetical protein CLAIMM_12543 [Cladophialophora immunda]